MPEAEGVCDFHDLSIVLRVSQLSPDLNEALGVEEGHWTGIEAIPKSVLQGSAARTGGCRDFSCGYVTPQVRFDEAKGACEGLGLRKAGIAECDSASIKEKLDESLAECLPNVTHDPFVRSS